MRLEPESISLPRCRLCGNEAVFYDYLSRRSLCGDHFVEVFESRVEETIRRYKLLKGVERLVVCVSGGKDSVALLHVLSRVAGEKVEIIGLHVDLGIKGYSEEARMHALENFKSAGVEYKILSLSKEHGFTIDDVVMLRRKLGKPACSVCGTVKRYLINKFAIDVGADAVATGHNLDDLVLFAVHSIVTGRVQDLVKLTPRSEGAGKMVTRIRPLALASGKETLAYTILIGASYQENPCPYTPPRRGLRFVLERKLAEIEDESPGFKRQLYAQLTRRIIPALNTSFLGEEKLLQCRVCGMPSSSEVCSFCKLKERLSKLLEKR